MKVYVVMGNDFPDCVFSTEKSAEEYCVKKKLENKLDRLIYWRYYEFEVKQ
jgi:hypothetical protein